MIVLTSGPMVLTPLALSQYSAERESNTLVHPILGRSYPEVTLRPMGMRVGGFTLDFPTSALAHAASIALRTAGVWYLNHGDIPDMAMTFIAEGVTLALEGDGRYPVEVSYREIYTAVTT